MATLGFHRLRLCAFETCLLVYCLTVFICSECGASDALDALRDKPYNTDFDWESTVIARGPNGCEFAKAGTNRPPPTCPPPSKQVDRATASQLGWKFAPILYQHPMDTSWLTDPSKWLANATAYDTIYWNALTNTTIAVPPGVQANNAMDEFLSAQQWVATRLTIPKPDFKNNTVSFDTVDGPTLLERAVMDPVVNGRLTGKVWYTAFRPYDRSTGQTIPHAWVYTYMYWYPWNGCSNQLVATQVDGKKQGVEYFMCGDGAHEGDLEHIKVYVCEADMLADDPSVAIRRTQYSQHGWLPDFDCTAGECEWGTDEQGVRRLVAYAALFSHANWVRETPLFVYAKVRLDMLLNMDGVYIGDRFKKGPVFYPTANNTVFLPFREEMTPEQLHGNLSWANFPGIWGATITYSGQRTITCFRNNFSEQAPCDPANPAYYILSVFINPKGWKESELDWTAQASGNTVTGPLWGRTFAYNWEPERLAPMYTNPKLFPDGYCPLQAPLQVANMTKSGFSSISLAQYLAVVTGLVIASAVVAVAMILPALLVRGDRAVIKQIEEEQEVKQAAFAAKEETEDAAAFAYGAGHPPEMQRGQCDHRTVAVSRDGHPGSCGGPTPPAAAAAAAAAPGLPPPGGAATATAAGKGGTAAVGGKSRLSVLLMSHEAILRAFHASVMQPWFLVAWMCVGIAVYIAGLVLGVIGVRDSVQALNDIYALKIWDILHTAVIAAFIVFGVIHFCIMVTSIWVRPFSLVRGCWDAKASQCHMECLNRSWPAHAILVGLLVMEMNVSMLLFAFGLVLWVARYMVTEACIFAIQTVFQTVIFLDDICLDLSIIGLPNKVCGSSLSYLCSIWGNLSVDYLSFGAMLFIIAQAMFLVLATTNYVATRTGYSITTVMRLTEKTERERAQRSAAGGAGSIGSGSGWRGALGLRNRSKGGSGPNGKAAAPLEAAKKDGGGGSGGAAAPVKDKAANGAAKGGAQTAVGGAAAGGPAVGGSGPGAAADGGPENRV